VRIPRLIGTARMMDMMLDWSELTVRRKGRPLGFSQYVVANGDGLTKGGRAGRGGFASNAVLSKLRP